jgi:hypothetical protein
VEELGGAGGFIGLEGADEVDLDVCEGGGAFGFLLPLLDTVFAEEALAGGVGFEEEVDGVELGNGHEGDLGGVAVGAGAGGGDFFVDVGEVGGDGHLGRVYRV